MKIQSTPILTLIALTALVASGLPAAENSHYEKTLSLYGDTDRSIYMQGWSPENPVGLVVFTHGFTDNSRNHRRLKDFLGSQGYAMAAWDMIGHGTSHGMRGYVQDFDDLLAALDQVRKSAQAQVTQGLPVYMAGYSMGGLVTLRYSQLHDSEIDGSLYFSPFLKAQLSPVRRFLNMFSKPLDKLLPTVRTPHGVTNAMLLTDPEVLKERDQDPYFFEQMTVHLYRQLLKGIKATQSGVKLMTKPVLFQVAGQELIVVRKETSLFYSRIPAATDRTYRFYPQMRHELDNEVGRDQVYRVLGDWLVERQQASRFQKLHER